MPESQAPSRTRSAPGRRRERALALKDRHTFKTEMDEEARLAMFPHLAKKVA